MPSAGGEVHNPTPAALGHVSHNQSGSQIGPRQIDRQHLVPLVQWRFQHAGVDADDGGGVDEDVDGSQGFERGGVCGPERFE